MTIEYRAGAIVNNGLAAVTTDVSFVMPAGAALGDLSIYAFVVSSTTPTVTASATGWTLLSPSPISVTTILNLFVYWKFLTAIDLTGTKTFTISSTARPTGVMDLYSGVDRNNPFEGSTQTSAGASTSQSVPAVTTLHTRSFVHNVWSGRNSNGNTAITVPAGTHTVRGHSATAFGAGVVNSVIASGQLTTPGAAGSYGPYSAPYSLNSSAGLWSLALQPSQSGGLLMFQ